MIRRLCALALVVACASAPLAAETQPAAWPKYRPLADWASTGLVGGQLAGASWAAWRSPDRPRAIACLALRVGVATGLSEGGKRLVHRDRPDGSDAKSFPSEHTAELGAARGWNLRISIPIWIAGAYLRGAADKHYFSDIAGGLAVDGINELVSRTVCR